MCILSKMLELLPSFSKQILKRLLWSLTLILKDQKKV